MTERVAVFRLSGGDYLGRNGRSTWPSGVRAEFRLDDALKVHAALRTRDWNDPLHGMSLELLPKRKTYHPLSEAEACEFLITMKTVRLQQEAAKYERLAEGYLVQAKHAQQQAEIMRTKAAQIRGEAALR